MNVVNKSETNKTSMIDRGTRSISRVQEALFQKEHNHERTPTLEVYL
ncbi:MAG TPA: hypothetical protein VLA72_00905 [Anaerolineales bacterium]|nr:hypothetical protein [Anaerolineales bacterium]